MAQLEHHKKQKTKNKKQKMTLTEAQVNQINEILPAFDQKGEHPTALELAMAFKLISNLKYRLRHATNEATQRSYAYQAGYQTLNNTQDYIDHLEEFMLGVENFGK